MTLLREHTLAFHNLLDVMRRQNVIDDTVILLGILSPMNMDTVTGCLLLELLQIVGKVSHRVFLYLTGSVAQILPFWQHLCHAVAFLAHAKERVVVAFHYVRLLLVSLGGF